MKHPHTAWTLSAEWLADMAETVGRNDAQPLTPALLSELVGALREDRDEWRRRARLLDYQVFICPVCRGTGMVPAGFYAASAVASTATLSMSTGTATEGCRTCDGRGVTSTHALPEDE